MANWYKELKEIDKREGLESIAFRGKRYSSLEDIHDEINFDFDDGYGGTNGFAFTARTKNKVYFPASHDGPEWIANVPRNPCNEQTPHIGG